MTHSKSTDMTDITRAGQIARQWLGRAFAGLALATVLAGGGVIQPYELSATGTASEDEGEPDIGFGW